MAKLDDIDPVETNEWLDALDSVLARGGKERAEFLISRISEGGVTFNSDGKSEQRSPGKDFPPRFSNNWNVGLSGS